MDDETISHLEFDELCDADHQFYHLQPFCFFSPLVLGGL